MGIRSFLAKPFASSVVKAQNRWAAAPVESQNAVFQSLLAGGKDTLFGKEHGFSSIRTYEDFKRQVPVRDYEDIKSYIQQVKDGKSDILWKGKPLYFAKTSGTTSGVKYIPISKESIPNHINSARNALLTYVHETGKADFLDRKLIFLSGSPILDMSGAIPTGRLSGIVNHHVPGYLRTNQLPSYTTNCIEDWETKLDTIIGETLSEDMSLISGIPPWVQMYFDRIIAKTGKPIKDTFPNFSLFVYGGVNFEPYRAKIFESIGKKIDSIEMFPASEGFFAYQDKQIHEGLLLLLNSGIFYEFIPAEEFFNTNPTRLSIADVELGKNYVLIVNNNAGLWGYNVGDTIKFVSKNPYRIIVSGRIKHFISAFGEHVIGEEVEKAMQYAMQKHPEVELIEFTVAPMVTPDGDQLPYHEWFVEFAKLPQDMNAFARDIDQKLVQLNVYYKDLISGSILQTLKITALQPDTFRKYMKSQGKLGGQNKVPRLSNDRKLADELVKFRIN
ncbi:GH3 auxin-responsive promoter family protein [Cytophagaceae bacterium DM2B3-1]|uniref:GH3 auxin-responsive promoter family protein n=1 Tax=Xanthocytophaga flava TaxID=3048013 RepID=A0ABT7CNL9_9BACT|nr:GH3 auxin-responsive promoter family protein [Xanthocytophaga flavus]MDJ1472999.1 GH3 auxin-responsive promoter family protein [Xanthocytophaga flavus]MDJ1495345.1 GH3 auxin-responsive promoter family protein [Xanthocytophaga flavus]